MRTTIIVAMLLCFGLLDCNRSDPKGSGTAPSATSMGSTRTASAPSEPSAKASPSPIAVKPSSSAPGDESRAPGAAPSAARSFPRSKECLPNMAFIPAGTFLMGSVHKEPESFREEGHDLAERIEPPHKVKVDAYCMDYVQATQGRYAKCVEEGVCSPPKQQKSTSSSDKPCNWQDPTFRESAVSCVNAHQAVRFCSWMGKRLPTEAEWEHAARGNDNRLHPWGDHPEASDVSDPEHAPICRSKGFTDYCPVASFPKGRSPFGIFDMVGSASDWTSSDLCEYPDHSCKHPEGLRIARGGRSYGFWITFRYAYDPERADPSLGIRCAAPPLRPDERP